MVGGVVGRLVDRDDGERRGGVRLLSVPVNTPSSSEGSERDSHD
jgi:hypothetical protein